MVVWDPESQFLLFLQLPNSQAYQVWMDPEFPLKDTTEN